MSDQRNLILAIVLSVAVVFGFQFFYEMPRQKEAQQRQAAQQTEQAQQPAGTRFTASVMSRACS